MSGGVAVRSFDDLGDPEGFGVGKADHLLELPPLEEEGVVLPLLGVDHLAGTVELSLLEIAVEALSGLIQLQDAFAGGPACFDLA